VRALDRRGRKLEDRINATISSKDALAEIAVVHRYFPWISLIASTMVITEMPELGAMTCELAAALAWSASFAQDSGTLRVRTPIAETPDDPGNIGCLASQPEPECLH
jgi:transposase